MAKTSYSVVSGHWRLIADGFKTREGATEWANAFDFGDGIWEYGWQVVEVTKEDENDD